MVNLYWLDIVCSVTHNLTPFLLKLCINPQIVNEVTRGNYPRKIDEYLAMGKPIIATNTRAMQMFKDCVYLGNTKEDYVSLIDKAFDENSTDLIEKRRQFAKSHSWSNNVKAIYNSIIKATKNQIKWD